MPPCLPAHTATLQGEYLDIKGQRSARPELYASDSYAEAQKFGEAIRAVGGAGILYDSPRRRTGINVVAHRPRNIAGIAQTDHFEVAVSSTGRTIEVRKLQAGPRPRPMTDQAEFDYLVTSSQIDAC